MSDEENREGLSDDIVANANKNAKDGKKSAVGKGADAARKIKDTTQNIKKLAKKNKVVNKLLTKAIASLGPLIPYILLAVAIILIIIAVIGIIVYLVTLPGMMSAKIKAIFDSVVTGINSIYESDVVASTSDEDVLELANYINNMDYDLIGYGFVKPDSWNTTTTVEELEEEGYERVTEYIPVAEREDKDPEYKVFLIKYKYDEEGNLVYKTDDEGNPTREPEVLETYSDEFYDLDGRKYDSTGLPVGDGGADGDYSRYGITYDSEDKIKDLHDGSSILRTYALSNRRLYVIRNNDETFLSKVFTFFNTLLNGYEGAWAQGLLELWNAYQGQAYDLYTAWDKGSIKIKDNNKLSVKVGWFSNPIEFDLDSWSGRYGLSTDFLISLHLATMSPDLVTTIAQTFDTRVQVYLDYIEDATVYAYFHTDEMKLASGEDEDTFSGSSDDAIKVLDDDIYVDYNALNAMKQDSSWNFFDGLCLSRKEAKDILNKYHIKSMTTGRYICGGDDPTEALLYFDDPEDHGQIDTYELVEGDGETSFLDVATGDKSDWDVAYTNVGLNSSKWVEKVEYSDVTSSTALDAFIVSSQVDSSDVSFDNLDSMIETLNSVSASEYRSNQVALLYSNYDDGYFGNVDLGMSGVMSYDRAFAQLTKGINDIFNRVQSNLSGYNVVEDKMEELPEKFEAIKLWEPSSAFYIGNYISFNEFKNIHTPDYGDAEEVILMVWPTNDNVSSGGDIDDPNSDAELVLSLLISYDGGQGKIIPILYRNFSYNEMKNKGFLDEGKVLEDESIICSATDDEEACANCTRYVKDIIKSLKKIKDDDFNTYEPYIARVVGSWFRDTYFIIPEKDDVATAGNGKVDGVYDYYDEYSGHGSGYWMHYGEDKNGDGVGDESVYVDNTNGDLTLANVNIIENNEELLEGTGELWTRYILDKTDNDYALFVIDSKGNYLESDSDVTAWEEKITDLPEDVSEVVFEAIEEPLEKNGIEYYGYIDVSTKVSSDILKNILKESNQSKNMSDIERVFSYYDISYIKRPVTNVLETNDNLSSIGWSAYEVSSGNPEDLEILEVSEESPNVVQNVQDAYNKERSEKELAEFPVFYYNLSTTYTLKQVEDGQRGMTNSKIKYLFKNKKYYKYDGSVQTAFQIRDDWKEVLDLYRNTFGGDFTELTSIVKSVARTAIKLTLGLPGIIAAIGEASDTEDNIHAALEDALNGYIDAIYYEQEISSYFDSFKFSRDFDGDGDADLASYEYQDFEIGEETDDGFKITAKTKFSYDPRNPDLISKVDITTESLTAFSILENTHTADADYAYRDLKELFVELDYFDTEDLVEPAKDILEWPLPESGSAGWPRRVFDKKEDVYGTYIHSESMYNTLTGFMAVMEDDGTSDSDGTGESDSSGDSDSTEESDSSTSTAKLYNEDKILKLASASRKVSSRDSDYRNNTDTPHMKSTFVETAEDCWKEVVDLQPQYDQAKVTDRMNFDNTSKKWIDCSSFVAWVLYNYGYADMDFTYTGYLFDTNFTERYGFTELGPKTIDISELQPGDIIVRHDSAKQHTQIIKEIDEASGTTTVFDCGDVSYWNTANIDGKKNDTFFSGSNQVKVIRVEASGKANNSSIKAFNGYEKGAPIVSPATAKVLEIGKVTINNETSEKYMESFYVADDETIENNKGNGKSSEDEDVEAEEGDDTADDSNKNKKIFVNQEQYDNILKATEEKEEDEESPFGKEYETGYVKLEIIGSETLSKFGAKEVKDELGDYYEPLNAFYEDYYNTTQSKTICDSYTIYIEGIDLTGTMEKLEEDGDDDDLPDIDSTIMGQLFTKNSASGSELLSSSTNVATDDASNSSTSSNNNNNNSSSSSTSGDFSIDDYQINYYTEKVIPKYYVKSAIKELEDREEAKKSLPSMIKLDNDLYIKAGTILGVAGDANMRIIMKDKDESVVENVEDYLEIEKFGKSNNSNGLDIDLAKFYFIPYEGGCISSYDSGKFDSGTWTCADTTNNDGTAGLAVGVCCWTTYADNSCNSAQELFKYLYNEDSSFYSELSSYKDMSGSQLYSNFSAISNVLIELDQKDHDKFLNSQLSYKEHEMNLLLEESARVSAKWILDRSPVLIGTYCSLVNWIPYPYNWPTVPASPARGGSQTWEDQLDESKSDEENIIALMKFAAVKDGGTDGQQHSGRFNSQLRLALDILNGDISEEDFNTWMETKSVSQYGEGANPGYISSH